MKKLLSTVALCSLLMFGWISPSDATNEGVCPQGGEWSSHFSANDADEFTYNAPDGYVVVELCVKAGSIIQGDGPEFTDFDPGVDTVTFDHSSGKDISHFSVRLICLDDEEEPTTTTTAPTTTSTTSITVPETTTTTPTTAVTTTVPETSTTVPDPTTTVPVPTTDDTVTGQTAGEPVPTEELARTGLSDYRNYFMVVFGMAITALGLLTLEGSLRKQYR
jgi:hypothetical protein